MQMETVAIIIPAYKASFLRQTLESVAAQTGRDFRVYVGDDKSPEDLQTIVQAYADRIPLVYRRFDENLGGTDLVAHWERCIRLSEEPLVWLFSDDDLMPSDAVERILAAWNTRGSELFFARFPLSVVDADGHLKMSNPALTDRVISGYEFLLDKLSGRISSAACEYVFSRKLLDEAGGFVHFPVAWCSDDATWARLADCAGGMSPLPGQAVRWRNADGKNISNSTRFDREKLKATARFVRWIADNYPQQRRDRELHRALAVYLHTILTCSVGRRYTRADVWMLVRELRLFSLRLAAKVGLRHFRF